MRKLLFPILIGLSALLVSASAAFYSVFGLSKLFAGAATQVIIMAGSLEFAKLITASLLYQYWGTINKFLRTYLSIAVFVLMIITSGGIYGFLSGAYQETATKSEFLDKSLSVLEIKQTRFEENKTDLKIEKEQLNKSISELRISLSNPVSVSYWDETAQQVITTTSSSSRRALQTELKNTIEDRNILNVKLETVQDSIMSLDSRLLELEISNEDERELGPLKYLAETTGNDMGQVVNWFLLLIVFVFDPLAIAMVVAANFAFSQIRKPEIDFDLDNPPPPNDKLKKAAEKYKEIKIEKEDVVMDDLETNIDDIPKEIKDKEDQLMLEAENRMNIIGQNGNDGLHYDERYLEKLSEEEDEIDEWMDQLSKDKGITKEDEQVPEPKDKVLTVKEKIRFKNQQLSNNTNQVNKPEDSNNNIGFVDPTTVLRYSNNRK
tara:strand:- start:1442 stop:2746 length:1305 start_codon:yes stop_codon:yes gene_type:complete